MPELWNAGKVFLGLNPLLLIHVCNPSVQYGRVEGIHGVYKKLVCLDNMVWHIIVHWSWGNDFYVVLHI